MNRRVRLFVPLFLALARSATAQDATPAAAAPVVPPAPTVAPAQLPAAAITDLKLSLTTLELLRQKGLISQAEYDAAMADLKELGTQAKSENTLVVGKFATTLYGFIEGDVIHDTTRSFTDLAGASAIAQPGTNTSEIGRTQYSVRNSRFGLRLAAPEFHGIRSSAQLEADFLGNQPGTPPYDGTSANKEASYFNNPTFRIRHAVLKMETDFVDVWVGQTWELVGWQSQFQPNTVAIQGVPGELYSRTAQVRLTHTFVMGPTSLEIAVAALRPPQMDSEVPDFQGGLKLNINALKGVQTIGQTGTGIVPASIGLSGGARRYRLPINLGGDSATQGVEGNVVAADILIPVIPATERKAFAVTVLGEAVTGTGDADLYTSLSGGAGVGTPNGNICATTSATCTKPYAGVADIDPGLAGWTPSGQLQTVDWRSLIVSGQIYLPPSGNLWLAGSYSNIFSDNIGSFGSAASVWNHEVWWDANLFFDATSAIRFGLEYSNFTQSYGNKVQATDQRVQFSGFFIY